MVKGTTVGLVLLASGIVLLISYGLILGLNEIIEELDLITGFLSGIILIGIIVLLVSIIYEQRKNTTEMNKKINKEDLKP